MKLDYNLKTIEERQVVVNQILAETPNPSRQYLDILASYLVLCMDKQERHEKNILTDNRLATVNKRETSYEGLVTRFENGEDGVYNILSNEKNMIFRPKMKITDEDRAEIPELAQATAAIEFWTEVLKKSEGKDKFVAKKALIEARKEQYSIRADKRPVVGRGQRAVQQSRYVYKPRLDGEITFDENGYCVSHGVTLVDPKVCSAILCNYNYLKNGSEYNQETDLWGLINEFDKVMQKALAPYPIYQKLVECKIGGLQNIETQEAIDKMFGSTHSLEYISSLWRKKIPSLIASEAEDEYLDWYYTEKEYGEWKKCSRCGKIKLAHNKYFSKNSTSKDGYYSICKKCRNAKRDLDAQFKPIPITVKDD